MIAGVRLAAPVLVVTDRGEVDGRPGDYLVIAEDGRQMIMTEAEFMAATGAVESSSPGIPEAESSPAPVRKGPAFIYSLGWRKRTVKPADAQVLEDPPAEEVPDEVMTEIQDPVFCHSLPEAPPEPEAPVRPPPPSQEGRSLFSLESLVIPKRSEGSFRRFMRPGPVEAPKTPKKKTKKRPVMVLPFQKKKVKKEQDPKKERYRYVKPEWV